jgi:hypothetical protein
MNRVPGRCVSPRHVGLRVGLLRPFRSAACFHQLAHDLVFQLPGECAQPVPATGPACIAREQGRPPSFATPALPVSGRRRRDIAADWESAKIDAGTSTTVAYLRRFEDHAAGRARRCPMGARGAYGVSPQRSSFELLAGSRRMRDGMGMQELVEQERDGGRRRPVDGSDRSGLGLGR